MERSLVRRFMLSPACLASSVQPVNECVCVCEGEQCTWIRGIRCPERRPQSGAELFSGSDSALSSPDSARSCLNRAEQRTRAG